MGSLILPPSGSVYVDANSVIYAVEKIEPHRVFWFLTEGKRDEMPPRNST